MNNLSHTIDFPKGLVFCLSLSLSFYPEASLPLLPMQGLPSHREPLGSLSSLLVQSTKLKLNIYPKKFDLRKAGQLSDKVGNQCQEGCSHPGV